jgi:hypothetical protein
VFLGSWVSIWGKTNLGFQFRGSDLDFVKWGKGHFGVFRKNKLVNGGLVGSGLRACHVIDNFVYYNSILATGGNGRVIGCNWRVNRAFFKFRREIEKVVIVEGGKV